ncbi:unnamed protein product [Trichobilharzia szidati]|nr:unnamed protein product [Trichobilharzia szidati]
MPPALQCICEICCCGRHKCPHRPKAIVPWGPCVMSEYSAQYHPHCISPESSIKPHANNLFASSEPVSDKTTHRIDYASHGICEPPRVYKPSPYVPPKGKMEDTTCYRNDFIPKLCPPPEIIKPVERMGCSAKFDGNPTYRSDYRPWDVKPNVPVKPKYEKSQLPKFDAQPTYRQEYIPHCMQKTESFKPVNLPKVYDEPFKGDTIYRTEYVTQPIQPKTPPKPQTIAKSTVPLDTLTTFRKDFTPKEICLNPSYKPSQQLVTSKDPISKLTTNRIDFKDWGCQPPERTAAPPYQPMQGDRYLDSTYRSDYSEKPICPPTVIKPIEIPKCDAKFDDTTNYRNDYVPWNTKAEHVKKHATWTPPTIPLDKDTTNRNTSSYEFVMNICDFKNN